MDIESILIFNMLIMMLKFHSHVSCHLIFTVFELDDVHKCSGVSIFSLALYRLFFLRLIGYAIKHQSVVYLIDLGYFSCITK